MSDPVVTILNGVPNSGTGTITTLGQTLVDGANATIGITTGSGVTTDASGTLQQYLRGLVKLFSGVAQSGAGTTTSTTQRVALASDSPGVTVLGQALMATSVPVTMASDQSAIPVKSNASSTGTQSIVASSATDVTILASNTNRLGATIYNDSTQILYILLSNATSSNTVYTTQLIAGSYYEVPFGYKGVIKGLWASVNGNARVTELT